MRNFFVTAVIAGTAIASAACAAKSEQELGPMAAKDFSVSDFTRIDSAGPYDVTVRTGPSPSVRAEGPQNVLDRLVIDVNGDELRIHSKNGASFNWSNSGPVKIAITVPALHGATLAGSGTLSVDRIVADRFKGRITGSGDLALPSVRAKAMELEITGSGSASIGGTAETAKYMITGSGELDASRLASKDIQLMIAGSGGLNATASGTVKGEILGSGEARITGGAKCSVDKLGSGSITCA